MLEGKILNEIDFATIVDLLKTTAFYGLDSKSRLPVPFNTATSKNEPLHSKPEPADRFDCWKVRFHSLGCLAALVRCHSKSFFQHLESFFHSASPSCLFSIFKLDSSFKVHIATSNTVASLFESCKSYFMIAESPNSTLTFTSFAHKLGNLIADIHTQLFSVLNVNSSEPLRPCLLKVTDFYL